MLELVENCEYVWNKDSVLNMISFAMKAAHRGEFIPEILGCGLVA